jgi:uncharacterized protein (TIGR03437 family)
VVTTGFSKMRHPLSRVGGATLLAAVWSVLAQVPVPAATCNIDFSQPQQRIDGFGASTAWYIGLARSASPQDRQKILDTLLSPAVGIGLTIVRNRIPPDIEPAEGRFDWTRDSDAVWFMQQARTYGVNRFISAPWTPPLWMKQTPDPNAWVKLSTDKWQAFADFLSRYAREYKSRFGIDIYGVSLGNEPDWDAKTYECNRWDAGDIHDFLLANLMPTFSNDSVNAKLTLADAFAFREDLVVPSLSDPLTRDRVDIVAAHAYYDPGTPFTLSKQYAKPMWVTEHSSSSADDPSIDDGVAWAKVYANYLAQRNVSAYCFWWLVGPGGAQSALVDRLPDSTLQFNKRLYTLGNFSRFIRPGGFRVAADYVPTAGVFTSAFQSGADFVIVAINDNNQDTTQSFNAAGFTGSTMTPYRTSADENLAQLDAVPVISSQFTANLRAKSVTTFVGQAIPFAVVSGAAYNRPALAPEEWGVAFGTGLATGTETASPGQLPLTLAGTQVIVKDSAGNERPAQLLLVSPGQVNFLMPAGTTVGPASITLKNGSTAFVSLMNIATVAPGLFSANGDGQGVPAAQAIAVSPDGSQTTVPVFQCGSAPGSCTSVPLDLGPTGSHLVLVLYGTGIRGRSALANVTCDIGGITVPVDYAGEQPQYAGLDQVNVTVPPALAGRGEVGITLSVDGQTSNTLKVNIK